MEKSDLLAFLTGPSQVNGQLLPDGRTFEDVLRAAFCLAKKQGSWMVRHPVWVGTVLASLELPISQGKHRSEFQQAAAITSASTCEQ